MSDSEGLWQDLLAGYESVRPLSGSERQLIPHFVLLRHIWVLASTVADHVEYPEMAPTFLTVPQRWDRAFSELREIAAGIDPGQEDAPWCPGDGRGGSAVPPGIT